MRVRSSRAVQWHTDGGMYMYSDICIPISDSAQLCSSGRCARGGRGRAVRRGLCMGECCSVQAEREGQSDRAGVAFAAGLVSQARRMDRRCRGTQSRQKVAATTTGGRHLLRQLRSVAFGRALLRADTPAKSSGHHVGGGQRQRRRHCSTAKGGRRETVRVRVLLL